MKEKRKKAKGAKWQRRLKKKTATRGKRDEQRKLARKAREPTVRKA